MPIYEYYCPRCQAEFEMLRPVSKADEPAPCKSCGEPSQRQLSSFAFKSNTFTSPRFKPSTNDRAFRPHQQGQPDTVEPDGGASTS